MPDSTRVSASDVRFDNWPVEDREGYADWDVQRATPREQGGTKEELAEEYEAELEEDVEWVGLTGGPGSGSPYLYSPQESALYEGELDEQEERVVLREAGRHEVDEASLGERIEEIGEEHDWEWLSSFAREYLEEEEEASFDHRYSEFQQRNVSSEDRHDLAFYGSHVYSDESGRIHSIERTFEVFLDDEASAVSGVEVEETYLIAEEPAEERRAGDAEVVEENEREVDVDFDAESPGWQNEVAARLEEWHENHPGWQSES